MFLVTVYMRVHAVRTNFTMSILASLQVSSVITPGMEMTHSSGDSGDSPRCLSDPQSRIEASLATNSCAVCDT